MGERPIVVGAGAAGLAVAATLGRRGIDCDILERAPAIGASWAARYDTLRLHTSRRLSGLPGLPIPARFGPWVARDDVVDYLGLYAAHHHLRPELGVEVIRLDRDGDRWRVETSAGPRHAPVVVLATSFSSRPVLPDWAVAAARPGSGQLPVVHSESYRNAEEYRGRRVLVVGAGNSGSEIAVDLAAAGVEVTMSVRRPPDILRRTLLGVPSQAFGIALRRMPERVMNPMGRVLRRVSVPDLSAYGLPAPTGEVFTRYLKTQTVPILDHGFVREIRAGRIRVVPAVRTVTAGGVDLVDGSTRHPDAVICATGYRPGLEPVVGHLGVLDESGSPRVHGAATVAGAPGLYFAGISVQLAGQLRELGIEARAIADAVATATRRTVPTGQRAGSGR